VFCDDHTVADKKEKWGMKMGTLWTIQVDMRNEGNNLPYLMLAMIPDLHFTPGSGSKPNHCQIGGLGGQ